MTTDALALENITMRFGTRTVLDGVNLRVAQGSIHGIIGENGAGKSTLMNIASGLLHPSEGRVVLRGEPRVWKSAGEAIKQGIGMVHQHFMLASPYTVLENVLVGHEITPRWAFLPTFLRPMQKRKAHKHLTELARQYDLDVDLDRRIVDLPVGAQQKVEILKVLYKKAEILILDEPTAVLTPQETKVFFAQLRRLRDEGKTIIIITHKLREVMAVTDEVTVLRAGKVTASLKTATTSPEQLACYMVGHDIVKPQPQRLAPGETVLSLKDVSASLRVDHSEALHEITLNLRQGEIVGVAGVSGNGQDALVRLLTHPHAFFTHGAKGTMEWRGDDVRLSTSEQLRDRGLAVVFSDRHRESVCLDLDLRDNYILGYEHRPRFSHKGWLRPGAIEKNTVSALQSYDVRPGIPSAMMRALSGGNQQKFVVGRELDSDPQVLVAAQPTRGVDIGAITMIHELFLRLRDKGGAILLISSDLDEIMTLSDRIVVMYQGRFVREFTRGGVTEEALGLAMGGHA